MATQRRFRLVLSRTTLVCSFVGLSVIGLGVGIARVVDCMDRFPEGRFGIPLSHHAATSGKLAVEGFAPLYLTKHQVSVPEAGMCDYVYTVDVFRMVGAVIPMVFRSRVSGYEITRINGITHPYGFGEDRSIWPGPMCIPKPSSGLFESAVGGKVSVVGDLFVVGWKTYFWNPAAERFDAILTSD